MELSPSQEAASYASTQQIVNILWIPTVHHRMHKILPPVVILSQTDQTHSIDLERISKSIFVLPAQLGIGLNGCLFLLTLQLKS
jgi:hypothetical protein